MASATHTFAPQNLAERARELFHAGRQIWWLVGDEVARYCYAVEDAVEAINLARKQRGGTDGKKHRPVQVIHHDRWVGFYREMPGVVPCKDKTNALSIALQIAIMSKQEIEANYPQLIDAANPNRLDFDPEQDAVFVFKSVDEELAREHLTLTLLRNVFQTNACSMDYVEKRKAGARGKRMLVLLSATTKMPDSIPELKPEIAPLPDADGLKQAALDGGLHAEFDAHEESDGKEGITQFDEQQWEKVTNALAGMTSQDAEEAIALALRRHHRIDMGSDGQIWPSLDAFLETLENEKGKTISKIPGLRYVPKSDIVDRPNPGLRAADGLPGPPPEHPPRPRPQARHHAGSRHRPGFDPRPGEDRDWQVHRAPLRSNADDSQHGREQGLPRRPERAIHAAGDPDRQGDQVGGSGG